MILLKEAGCSSNPEKGTEGEKLRSPKPEKKFQIIKKVEVLNNCYKQ